MSYWGATVIINLLSVVSYQVCVLLWRRFVVSEYTVTRFYVLHFFNTFGPSYISFRPSSLTSCYWKILFILLSSKNIFFPIFDDERCFSLVFLLYSFRHSGVLYSNSLRDAENFIHANSMVTPIH